MPFYTWILQIVSDGQSSGDSLHWVNQLPEAALTLLNQHAVVLKGQRQQPFFIEEFEHCTLFLCKTGYIRVSRINEAGKRFTLNLLKPGDLLGWQYPLTQASKQFQLTEASENLYEGFSDFEVWGIPENVLTEAISQIPAFYLSIIQQQEHQRRQLENRFASLLFKDVQTRLVELILSLKVHYAEPCPYAFGLNADITLTHQEIAELIGATRQVVTKILNQLIREDLIHKHNGKICIQNEQALIDLVTPIDE
jgi:CRP/FNR family cyclic AMP-dependent transcriptional regulator